jgi:hypothetical protein
MDVHVSDDPTVSIFKVKEVDVTLVLLHTSQTLIYDSGLNLFPFTTTALFVYSFSEVRQTVHCMTTVAWVALL